MDEDMIVFIMLLLTSIAFCLVGLVFIYYVFGLNRQKNPYKIMAVISTVVAFGLLVFAFTSGTPLKGPTEPWVAPVVIISLAMPTAFWLLYFKHK